MPYNNNRNFSVLEARKVQDQGPCRFGAWWGGPASWFTGGCFLVLSSQGRKGKGPLWGLFYKSINPIHESSTLRTQSPPKGPLFPLLQIWSCWGLGFNMWIFCRGTQIFSLQQYGYWPFWYSFLVKCLCVSSSLLPIVLLCCLSFSYWFKEGFFSPPEF